MSVSSARTGKPSATAQRRSASAPALRARPLRQERAAADLDVHDQSLGALRDLLRQDRRRDERDRLDGGGGVAQRVEDAVGRHQARGLARRARSPRAPARARSRAGVSAVRKPGIASSLSSVPPVWPSARPAIIGTVEARTRRTAAPAHSEILSPTPPVECLSTAGAAQSRSSAGASPESIIASVQVDELARRHAAPDDRHQQAPTAGSRGSSPRGRAGDDRADVAVGERAAVAFGARSAHGTAISARCDAWPRSVARKLSPWRQRRHAQAASAIVWPRSAEASRACPARAGRTPGPNASSGTRSRV